MKVKELIWQLRQVNSELPIVVCGVTSQDGKTSVTKIDVPTMRIVENKNSCCITIHIPTNNK